jgi:hypothetical protein
MTYREKIDILIDEALRELAKEKPNLRHASELLKDVKEVHLDGMDLEVRKESTNEMRQSYLRMTK